MRKSVFLLCLLLFPAIFLPGCAPAQKSESEIREIAYYSLYEMDKETVLDWKNAEVAECRSESDHPLGSPAGLINIKGIDTYRITFRTDKDAALGPITLYMDKTSYRILGGDLRD